MCAQALNPQLQLSIFAAVLAIRLRLKYEVGSPCSREPKPMNQDFRKDKLTNTTPCALHTRRHFHFVSRSRTVVTRQPSRNFKDLRPRIQLQQPRIQSPEAQAKNPSTSLQSQKLLNRNSEPQRPNPRTKHRNSVDQGHAQTLQPHILNQYLTTPIGHRGNLWKS